MNTQQTYDRLSDQAPNGYRVNELIPFAYPVRKVVLEVTVNKSPDDSLTGIYSSLLRAIDAGFQTEPDLFAFLGLSTSDEFIRKELMYLRSKGYVDQRAGAWRVSADGRAFMADNGILREDVQEEFTFLIDGLTGMPISMRGKMPQREELEKSLKPRIIHPAKSPELLAGRSSELASLYRAESNGQAFLVGYAADGIKRDFPNEWLHHWLVEYVPTAHDDGPPILEVRANDERLSLDKDLTNRFRDNYEEFLFQLTDSDRAHAPEILPSVAEIPQAPKPPAAGKKPEQVVKKKVLPDAAPSILTIYETERVFIQALETAKERLLIESPWVKQATDAHLGRFRSLLDRGVMLYILYGIAGAEEHDERTLRKLRELSEEFPELFHLVHLPALFARLGIRMTGTHRKMVIKDNEFMLVGSFNYLSLGGTEQRKVANEQSVQITTNVDALWRKVMKEYRLRN
jgi:hypothetical protein